MPESGPLPYTLPPSRGPRPTSAHFFREYDGSHRHADRPRRATQTLKCQTCDESFLQISRGKPWPWSTSRAARSTGQPGSDRWFNSRCPTTISWTRPRTTSGPSTSGRQPSSRWTTSRDWGHLIPGRMQGIEAGPHGLANQKTRHGGLYERGNGESRSDEQKKDTPVFERRLRIFAWFAGGTSKDVMKRGQQKHR